MANQPLQDTFKLPYFATELDADGNQAMDPGDSVAVTTDDTAKATVAPDATVDPAKVPSGTDATKVLQTGFLVGGSKLGTVNVTATFSHTDGTAAPPPISVAVDILSGPPVTGGFGFGTAVPQ